MTVDRAPLVGGEEHAATAGLPRQRHALPASERRREARELLAGSEGRIDRVPVHAAQSLVGVIIDADEPVVTAARAGVLTGEDDTLGEYQL
jgi:hypothetical protein